jgi:hypothetical protein
VTIGLSQLTDLQRVRIAISGYPNGAVTVERSINQLWWVTVQGGVALPVVAGAAQLDDYYWPDAVENFYRVSQASLEETVDVFTTSDTWTKPLGLVAARITVVGPGGGGAGAGTTGSGEVSGGSGGGAGAVSVSVIDAASLGATETVTVGTGGAGGVGANGGSSGSGSSSFGSHVVAGAGSGGNNLATGAGNASLFGGTGGSSGTGDVVMGGSHGEGFLRVAPSSTLPNGGDSRAGPGGRAGSNSDGFDGQFGGGGGGTRTLPSQGTARNGGAGGGGLVLVEHIFAG